MAQLTGSLLGTRGNDTFVGQFETKSVNQDTVGAGIEDASISTLSGDDVVEGKAVIIPNTFSLDVTGIGIARSTIVTSAGDDTISATGFGARFFEGFDSGGPTYNGVGTSYGLLSSTVNSGSGADILTFDATIVGGDRFEFVTSEGFGIFDSAVTSGSGDDQVSLSGKVGAAASSVVTGAGQDTVTVESSDGDRGATGLDGSRFVSGGDDDSIAISATGVLDAIAATGSQIVSGSGDDTISLFAEARIPSVRNGFDVTTTATGADAQTSIFAGDGNDTISIMAVADSATVFSTGVKDSRVDGGNGNDAITLRAEMSGLGGAVYGADNAVIAGGNGDDVLTFVVQALSSDGSAAGANQSLITGGAGNDIIRFEITNTLNNAADSAGVAGSKVFGGFGDDVFEVKTDTLDGFGAAPAYDIVDTVLGGGSGDDVFNVGIGDGRLIGGAGSDLAIVSYLDVDTMTVEAISGGVRITGTQTNNGEAGGWRQDILSTESFVVGDVAYTAGSFVKAFGS